MHELSDEELLAAIAAGPGFLPEFYRRHVAKVTGVGVRRFSRPEVMASPQSVRGSQPTETRTPG